MTELVSVSTGGVAGDDGGGASSISPDGRFIAFHSFATNLVPDDTNGRADIFVRDRRSGRTERVSVGPGGAQGNSASQGSAISANGRFVAFASVSSNLVAGDTNGANDIFVRDRLAKRTERVSVGTSGTQADGSSSEDRLAMSADGRFVAFASIAENLVPGDTNLAADVFVRDRQAGTTERVSVGRSGAQGNSRSLGTAISADGRFVAFGSFSTNLVPSDTNLAADVFVRDRQAGTTERVSVGPGGEGDMRSASPAISADGRFVAFTSGPDLVPGSGGGVYLRDRQLGRTEWVSVSTDGGPTSAGSPAISPGGRFVAFDSQARNQALGDFNGRYDVFIRDRQVGRTELVSVGLVSPPTTARSSSPSISAGGRSVVFSAGLSSAPPGQARAGVFVRNR